MDINKMGLRPTSPTRPITPDCPRGKHSSRFGMWQKLQNFFNHRDGSLQCIDSSSDAGWSKPDQCRALDRREGSTIRPVGVGLPRQTTFKRQNSEKRDRLCPVESLIHERRAHSTSRPKSKTLTKLRSNSVPTTSNLARCSAPAVGNTVAIDAPTRHSFDVTPPSDTILADSEHPVEYERERPLRPASPTSSTDSYNDQRDYFEDRSQLNRELDTKWILNLSMHFRDKSDREKFFVTYAETPTRWRRVTVSCDYRNAESGSLEMDLKELQLQRDKSMQIYEAIRDSLTEINFFDTVTNLKLETSNGRLHVHVTEDVNEIIPYPPINSLQHILSDDQYRPKKIRESELSFEAHLSGFVYKVAYKNKPYIKKEIPGPDTVEEFLYEVNALHALQDSQHVIDLEGIITDETGQTIKGLLINYADRGAVVDLLYDYKGEISWELRERWARHAIQGLSDIHEEGYVQGDFTLSNIVVDHNNSAKIIDINRRGCPVGWEPPEIAKKISSNQRISMYIGQKSDLYQLGMTLWALAMDDDEPERHDPPLSTQEFPAEVPLWYQEVVRNCLSTRPRDRMSATQLLGLFPPQDPYTSWSSNSPHQHVRIRTEKQYIDPATAVERDDLERYRDEIIQPDENRFSPESSRDDYTFTWPQSSSYDREHDDADSLIERPRGRRRVSDHDLELQARRRRERTLTDDFDVDHVDNGSTPIITISGNEATSHMIENRGDDLENGTVDMNGESRVRDISLPDLSTSISAFDHLSEGGPLFRDYSDTSDDTPRHSNLYLFDTETSDFDHVGGMVHIEHIPDDLAGMGTHPNFSNQSFENVQYDIGGSRTEDHSGSSSAPTFPEKSGDNDSAGLEVETTRELASDNDLNTQQPESEQTSFSTVEQEEGSQKIPGSSVPDSEKIGQRADCHTEGRAGVEDSTSGHEPEFAKVEPALEDCLHSEDNNTRGAGIETAVELDVGVDDTLAESSTGISTVLEFAPPDTHSAHTAVSENGTSGAVAVTENIDDPPSSTDDTSARSQVEDVESVK